MVLKDFHGQLVFQEKYFLQKGICPNAEELNDKSFIAISFSSIDINENLISLFSKCFHEVWTDLNLPFKK